MAVALATSRAELLFRAQGIAASLSPGVAATAVESAAAVGGGGAPGVSLGSAAVALPADLAEPLRADAELPVVGRLERGRLLLDLIAVASEDDPLLVDAVRRAAARVEDRA